MKALVFSAVILASSLALAKADDQWGYCVIRGTKAGVTRTMKGPEVWGGWWKARRAAYKMCNSKGYAGCKVEYCRINN